jgi:carbonic anhydrase
VTTATDQLLANNAEYASGFDHDRLPQRPAKKVAIVTCMDSRLDPARALGLVEGDAHVLRNAGGVVTEDVIRSLVISQRLLGTEEVMVVQHTGCGMASLSEAAVKEQIEADTGVRPTFALEAFDDLEQSIRRSVALVRKSPFVPNTDVVRGFVYEVETGRVREVL